MGMVIRATEKDMVEKAGLEFRNPTTQKELREYKENCFFVKISSPSCGPCRQLQSWLESYEAKKKIPIVSLDVSQRNELVDKICNLKGIRFVPYFALLTRECEVIEDVRGFDQDAIEKMLDEYESKREYKPSF